MISTPSVKPVPQKLRNDALIEALLEIRFDTQTIPEVLVGRLADHAPWKGFQQRRLPLAEIPAPIRQTERNLRYSPLFELADPEHNRLVRIGEHVVSYHQLRPYVGWAVFREELRRTVDGLFEKAGEVVVRRLGLRYINALTPQVHGIKGILDLDLKVSAAGLTLPGNVNLNFTTDVQDDMSCTVRVATSEFVGGNIPEGTSVVIDVDVFTKPAVRIKSAETVKNWVDTAHTREKEQFFRLLTTETIEALAEK
jgi:uncharacterized protein (TIGR04255 family)